MPDARTLADNGWLRAPLFTVFLIETAALIARSQLQVRLRESGYAPDYASDLSYLVVPPILLLLMYPVMQKYGAELLKLFRARHLTVRVIVTGVLLGVALRCAYWGGLISMTAFGIATASDDLAAASPQFSWQCPLPWVMGLGILVSSFLIPSIEESINRGFFLHGLLHRGNAIAILTSSILFAVFHDPQSIYVALAIGLIFAVATLNSGALWISTIAHATYNLILQFDWRCFGGRWQPLEISAPTSAVGAMATALLIVSLVLASLLVSKRFIGTPVGAR